MNQHVDSIEKSLTELKDRDSLLKVGRAYIQRAKAQGISRTDLNPLLAEHFGDETTGSTTGTATGSRK